MKKTIYKKFRYSLLLLFSLALVSCATHEKWPAITSSATNEYNPGRWVWADLVTDDIKQAQRFYNSVFGWKFNKAGSFSQPYLVIMNGMQPVGGILRHKIAEKSDRSARWISHLSVASVSAATEQVELKGGKVIRPWKRLDGRGDIAIVADPEGAIFGLLRAEQGDPVDTFPKENAFFWHELWANDLDAMSGFYRSLADYKTRRYRSIRDVDEIRLSVKGIPRSGIIQVKRENIDSAWLPYVRVSNLNETLDKVRQANGDVIVSPAANVRTGKVAVIRDDQGAALGLVEWHETLRGEVMK